MNPVVRYRDCSKVGRTKVGSEADEEILGIKCLPIALIDQAVCRSDQRGRRGKTGNAVLRLEGTGLAVALGIEHRSDESKFTRIGSLTADNRRLTSLCGSDQAGARKSKKPTDQGGCEVGVGAEHITTVRGQDD